MTLSRSFVRTSLLALIVAALPVALLAQGADQALLRGLVREQGGRPLAGARVTFSPADVSTETDGTGQFTLRVPARTAGELSIRRLGFFPVTVSVSAIEPGDTRRVGVTLPGREALS